MISLAVISFPDERSVIDVNTAPITTKAIAIQPIIIDLAPCHSRNTQTPTSELPISWKAVDSGIVFETPIFFIEAS